jgi:Bacterial Ig domain
MWRWVTRGLILTLLALLAPALLAQDFVGDLELPDPGRIQSGMILVKGWAIDPHQIAKIELWVDDTFQHEAVKFLPRVDIIEAYPDYPGIHQARPGFITGFSANRFPDGPHTVEVRVILINGDVHSLGRRTININNSVNQAPFGFVDIPGTGPIHNAAGAFPVSGWAADIDGIDRIEVLIDDGVMQGAVHGDPRPDVGTSFPDFTGALYSGWVANVDTTRVQNGVHLLTVRAIDRKGMSTLLGRRQIQVINNDQFLRPFGVIDEPLRDAVLQGTCNDQEPPLVSPPIRPTAHLTPVRGWALDLGTRRDLGRVAYVSLLIDGVEWISSDACGANGLGRYANCYGLPRYDVQRYYPNFPDAPRAGFLFTLDVGALLQLGVRPGNHFLTVRVGDREQTFADLPNRDGIPVWFECATDSLNVPGQGFIEFPNSFDYVTGDVTFRGWALIPANTERLVAVELTVDGNFVGSASYGYPRTDIEDQFPFITGARNSGWIFTMDTRRLSNARHRLTARTVDAQGTRTEIGSVDFYVQNNSPQP